LQRHQGKVADDRAPDHRQEAPQAGRVHEAAQIELLNLPVVLFQAGLSHGRIEAVHEIRTEAPEELNPETERFSTLATSGLIRRAFHC